MALKKKIQVSGKTVIQSDFGAIQTSDASVELDCYIKVISVEGGKESCAAHCHFSDAEKGAAVLRVYNFAPSVADGSPNFIAQAYDHLKTLPDFADAVDC